MEQKYINDNVLAKTFEEMELGQEIITEVKNKGNFRKYLSEIAKKANMQFVTRSVPGGKQKLKVIRFN